MLDWLAGREEKQILRIIPRFLDHRAEWVTVLLMEMGTPRKTRLCVSESWEEAWKVSVECVVETPLRIFF